MSTQATQQPRDTLVKKLFNDVNFSQTSFGAPSNNMVEDIKISKVAHDDNQSLLNNQQETQHPDTNSIMSQASQDYIVQKLEQHK